MRTKLTCERRRAALSIQMLLFAALGCLVWPVLSVQAETPRRSHTANTLRLRLTPGYHLRYAMSYSSTATMNLAPALQAAGSQTNNSIPPPIALTTNLRGTIELLPVRQSRRETLVQCRIRPDAFQLNINGREAAEPQTLLLHDLEHPILVTVEGDGQIRQLRFDPSCDSLTQGVARTLLTQFQFSAPRTGETRNWDRSEQEPNGTFLARYHYVRSARNGVTTLHKTKLPTAGPGVAEAHIGQQQSVTPQSDLELVFDRHQGVMQSVQGVETFITRLGGVPVARTRSVISVRLEGRDLLPQSALAVEKDRTGRAEAGMTPVSLGEARGITLRQEAQIQKTNLGGASWTDLQRELASMDQAIAGSAVSQALLVRLKACFYLMPQTCVQAAEVLRTARAERVPTALIVEALRGAGHVEAQRTLLSIGRERRDDTRFQELLLPSLARLEQPILEAGQYLREMAMTLHGETGSTAILALGSLAHTLAQTSSPQARSVLDEITRGLARATTTARKTDWLLALGNAGNPSSLPLILRYTRQADPEIRAAAIFALGHQRGDAVDRRLAEALGGDDQVRVRLTAAYVTESRPLSAALKCALQKALVRDTAGDVRLAAARALWRQGRAQPSIRGSLQAAAAKDASRDIRRAVTALLTRP